MMKKNIWFIVALLVIGFSLGLITSPLIVKTKVYNTTVKRIKQNRGTGDIVIDIEAMEPEKTKKEIRKEKRQKRKES